MKTITRKEIISALSISEDTFLRREKEWGLMECRSKSRLCPIEYFPSKVNEALLRVGVIIEALEF